MSDKSFASKLVTKLLEKLLSVEKNESKELGEVQNVLVVRQHNQLGDLLSGVSLFRALKEKYPECKITLIVSPDNHQGIVKNKFIDRCFIFDKNRLLNPSYFFSLRKILREGYDIALVPVVVSISFTSNLIARLSKSKIRIGCESLDGKENESAYLFDRRIKLYWKNHPDSNVSERCLDIVRPFGIDTNNYRSEITIDYDDLRFAHSFVKKTEKKNNQLLIGFHVGAGKPQNRWSLNKYVELIKKLNKEFNCVFYLAGSDADRDEIDYVIKNSRLPVRTFLNKTIPQVAALISLSYLFISNDTGIMHVAGTTETPQISIFGPTNPFNWAPIGPNKFFIRESELIDDVEVDDVFQLCIKILNPVKK
ncbi:MAG: glycosyltransferase family 9 protein [Ignavibacteriaceae bacterium]|nr:glycosyltransferase family 9 protein [Ignavibacteriaceae bacterium]